LETSLRPYEVEALEWALETLEERSGAIICLLTETGKTLVGVAFAERVLKEGLNVLVLEPTGFLVEQVSLKFRREGLESAGIHSGIEYQERSKPVYRKLSPSAAAYINYACMKVLWKLGSTAWCSVSTHPSFMSSISTPRALLHYHIWLDDVRS
jgi:hypothetical protein